MKLKLQPSQPTLLSRRPEEGELLYRDRIRRCYYKISTMPASPLSSGEGGGRGSKKKTFKERQEFASVEASIAALEAEKAAIEEALCTGTLAADELTAKSIRLSSLNEELDEKTMRWLELSEIPD